MLSQYEFEPSSEVQSQVMRTARPQSRTVRCFHGCDETTLLEGLLGDDANAWREFNVRYARLIYACIGRITARFGGVVRADAVNDIYSMLCVQLLSNDKVKLRTFEPGRGSKLGTWLGLLATHTAYDYLRSVRRIPRHADLTEAEQLSSDTPDPSEETLVRERAQIASEVLASFSDKDREFARLYYGEGLTPEDVARRMRISIKTVYSKKHKIQRRLETLLAEPHLAA
ncbi:MAG TPA: sigma-70 family RNA polymerase sigma factor [Polyangiaceae bacterium]|nr:sigma-70 family RNA polymerase sigma factor [Polyangiaceae bacterium]